MFRVHLHKTLLTQSGGSCHNPTRQAVGHPDVLLQRVDVPKHVRTVVAVESCDVAELHQGKRCRRGARAPSAGAVGFADVLVEVVECGQSLQAELTRVALLWLICVDGLQVNLQHSQAVEVSL